MQNEEATSAEALENGYDLQQLRKSVAMLAMDLCHARSVYRRLERIADSMSDGNRALVRKIDELEDAAKEAGERLGVTMKEKAELSAQVEALKDGRSPDWMLNRDDQGVVVGIHWGGRYFSAASEASVTFENDGRRVTTISATVNSAHDCLVKCKPGEPFFVLLGRDPEGAATIRFWADRRSKRSFGDNSFVFEKGKIDEAREIADAFDKWRIENGSSAKPRGNGGEPRPMVPRRPED